MPGSDKSISAWHSNLPDKLESLLFFESPIDALSYYELKRNDKALYTAFGGQLAEGQLLAVKYLIDKATVGKEVMMFSCFDHDKAGERFTNRLQDWFKIDGWQLPEKEKDWNEWLQYTENRDQRTKTNYSLQW